MPDIFTKEWYDTMLELANSRDDLVKRLQQKEMKIAFELEGDGVSPYIPAGEFKYFFLHIVDGRVKELSARNEKIKEKGLSYRISGPASAFESIAAGLADPIERTLDGTLSIRGDMRFLIQNADFAKVICEVYMSSDKTSWSKGKPPYEK
jgi:hypothetical protein